MHQCQKTIVVPLVLISNITALEKVYFVGDVLKDKNGRCWKLSGIVAKDDICRSIIR